MIAQQALLVLRVSTRTFASDERHSRLLGDRVDEPVQIEQVDAHEDDDKATEKGYSWRSSGRVEAAEKEKRSQNCRGSEGHIVDRVDTVSYQPCASLV